MSEGDWKDWQYAETSRLSTAPLTSSVAFFSVIAMSQAAWQFDRNNIAVNVVIRVTDSNNGKVDAEVSLQASGILARSGSTDERGDCFFRQVPPGEYVVIVSIRGRERWKQELVLTANEGLHSELIRLSAENGAMPSQISVMDLNVPHRAAKKYRAGVLNAHSAKWREAERNLREAISECPTYARAFNALGVVLEMQTRHEEAEAAFRKATALDNKFGEAHLNLGHLLIVKNRRSEAVIELQHVLSTDPRNKETVALLADTYLAVGDDRGMRRLSSSSAPYDALQVQVSKPMRNRFSLQANLTWDKVMLHTQYLNPFDTRLASIQDSNPTLLANIRGTFELPRFDSRPRWQRLAIGGWKLNGVFRAAIGSLISAPSNVDIIGPVAQAHPTYARYFNTCYEDVKGNPVASTRSAPACDALSPIPAYRQRLAYTSQENSTVIGVRQRIHPLVDASLFKMFALSEHTGFGFLANSSTSSIPQPLAGRAPA